VVLFSAIQVTAPRVLSYTQNSAETIAFFDRVKQAVFTTETSRRKGEIRRKSMRLNLAGIESISLPCAVVLSAELKRWTMHSKRTPNLLNYGQWNRRVRSLLVHLGTLKHLGIQKKSYQRYSDETFAGQVILVELTSAEVQDGEKVAHLQEQLMELGSFFEPKKYIFRALLEATNNAIEHAYDEKIELKYADFKGKRWYATASYDPSKDSLRFFVYDQGIGIPESLRSKGFWRRGIADLLDKIGLTDNDTDTIDAAFELGKTRTDKDERGKGLKDMQNVIQQAGAGYIRVISGQGDYTLNSAGAVEKRRHGSHIGGTLIEWSIPISALNSEENVDD
jgi:hypothetical protein